MDILTADGLSTSQHSTNKFFLAGFFTRSLRYLYNHFKLTPYYQLKQGMNGNNNNIEGGDYY